MTGVGGSVDGNRCGASLGDSPRGSHVQGARSVRIRFQFFANNGAAWDLAANGAGVVDAGSGDPIFASFQWGFGNSSYPPTVAPTHGEAIAPQVWGPDLAQDSRYPVFVRNPDPLVVSGPGGLAQTRGFATAPISPSAGFNQLAFTGSDGGQAATAQGSGGTIRFDAPSQMQGLDYTVAIDLSGDGTFGNANDVTGAGALTPSANSFAWDGHDAAGVAPACGAYAYQVRSTLPALHLVQSDTENSNGTQIERLSLPGDPGLGDAFAASYNDVDPYKSTAITNSSPSAVTAGTSGPGFHAWSGSTGHTDFIDTWAPPAQITTAGTLQVLCADLAIGKSAPATVEPGGQVTWTITVTNNGPGASSGAMVEDSIRQGSAMRPARRLAARSEPARSPAWWAGWR